MPLDYNRLSATYDSHRRGGGPYGETLTRLARQTPHRDVLEMGAGTGLNTAYFLSHVPCRLVALERSPGMLARGRLKAIAAQWVNGNAAALPFTQAAFDFLFGTYMLHHIRDLASLFSEAYRVLRPGGCAAFVTVREEFIRHHPMNDYFPSFARVDLQRFQPVPQVEEAMRAAHFNRVHSITDEDPPRPIDWDYAERVANRFISTYELIPQPEFSAGLSRLRQDLERGGGRLEGAYVREASTVAGYK